MESLLNYAGLEQRMIKDDVDIMKLPIVGYNIDTAQLKIELLRQNSEKFLKDALENQ